MINIFRSLNGCGLTAQVAIGRTKAYIDITEDVEFTEGCIGQAAQAMGGDFSRAVTDYRNKVLSMEGLSREAYKRVRGIELIDAIMSPTTKNDDTLVFWEMVEILEQSKPLVHQEIYWLDWFLRKHKLGGKNGQAD